MKRIATYLLSVIAIVVVGSVAVTGLQASAADCTSAKDCVTSGLTAANGGTAVTTTPGSLIKNIVNILLFILGAIAVIMIIIGGLRYTTSNGDASHVKAAKDTILYAVIGLVVALLAYAIVNFVVTNIGK